MNNRLIRCLLLLVATVSFFAREVAARELPQTDSLVFLLSTLDDNEQKISVLNTLATILKESNPDKALAYSRQALAIATRLQSIPSCAVSNKVMGEIFEYRHNFQPSINYYLISIKHFKSLDDKDELARIYNRLGHIYINNHYDYEQGMLYVNTAMEYAEEAGNSKEMAAAYNSLGGIYYYRNDLDKASSYFRDALRIREEIGDESGIAASLNNVGEIYRLKGDFGRAIDYYQQAIKINQRIRHNRYLSINYLNLGLIFSEKEDEKKALEYFGRSIALNREEGDTASIINGMLQTGNFYLKIHKYDEANATFDEMMRLAMLVDDLKGQHDASFGQSLAYDGKGNTRKAFELYKQYSALHDTLFARAKADQLDELHSRLNLRLKEKELALKDNEIALLQREKSLAHSRQLLLLLSLIAVIAITILIYSQQQSRHYKNKLMMEQEAALSKAKQDLMEVELRNKSNDLTNVALHLVEKNKFLQELQAELKKLREVPPAQRENRIKELTLNVQQNINQQKDLDEFQAHIDELNRSFYSKLRSRFPNLTKNEEHLCAMLRLDLSSKEIASLNNITVRAVEMGRYRLRKKFNIPSTLSISDFLKEL